MEQLKDTDRFQYWQREALKAEENPHCKKCGLKRISRTREATRDFVFVDICIKCNMKK